MFNISGNSEDIFENLEDVTVFILIHSLSFHQLQGYQDDFQVVSEFQCLYWDTL